VNWTFHNIYKYHTKSSKH